MSVAIETQPPTVRFHRSLSVDIWVSIAIAVVATGGSYLLALWGQWITSINPLEAFAVFTSYSCTYLCVVQRRINYPIGAISSAAYCVLFFEQGLLGSTILNAYLTPALLYGWLRWRADTDARPVTLVRLQWWPVYLGLSLLAWLGATMISRAFGGQLAALDSIILVGSILAQFLLDNKKLENWIIWFVVDVIAIWEYFHSGLALAGVQYVLFLLNTVYGFVMWMRSRREQTVR